MGIESFYVNLLVIDSNYRLKRGNHIFSGSKRYKKDEILSFLEQKNFCLELVENNKYSVDGLFYLEIISNKKFFQGISFEGCFSCYDKVLKRIAEVVDCINKDFAPLKIFKSGKCFANVKEERYLEYKGPKDLIDFIDKTNESKRADFNKVYPFYFDSLPGKTFYQKIKYVRLLNFFMSKTKVNE